MGRRLKSNKDKKIQEARLRLAFERIIRRTCYLLLIIFVCLVFLGLGLACMLGLDAYQAYSFTFLHIERFIAQCLQQIKKV